VCVDGTEVVGVGLNHRCKSWVLSSGELVVV